MDKQLPKQTQELNLYAIYLKEVYNKGEMLIVQLAFTLDEALYSVYGQLEEEGKHSQNFSLNAWLGIPFKAIEGDAYSGHRTPAKTKGTIVEAPSDNGEFMKQFGEFLKESSKERLTPELKRKNALMKKIIKVGDIGTIEKYAGRFTPIEMKYMCDEIKKKKK